MKIPLLSLSLGLMLTSWVLGIYFISFLYSPTIIIPLFDQFLWMSETKGLLGLTTLFTLFTLPLIGFLFKTRHLLKKRKIRYTMLFSNYVVWLAIIASQLKITAYNLGICH
ncbi:hypothetical protein [Halobacillus sp. BBL2006]|uniref:hypothetical protein n=1 Tax=Halobacillus sp. BBL2006 TaxID=1543706 RepID=UPI000542FAEB|nr:hypothetical protein [Halobacillus sp. BBL2006]KHE72017.1 hypothetical protein LD39_06765 [Halobacillus sp. BBL2006]